MQRNLRFLADYLRSDGPAVATDLAAIRAEQVVAHGSTTLAVLLATLPTEVVDALYTLIATEQIVVDLTALPLADPECVVLLPAAAPRTASLPRTTVAPLPMEELSGLQPPTPGDRDDGAPAAHASPTAWKLAYER
ncbi:MAG: hypothetical protein GFH27_549311n51 [Chloroflexi bacterium AL-W]|nr:hypothetical protein [Chloroflexi bacterium AL-N1]NOK68771.1 hypothetical protein [Chloroflexi bacterium AL-N10]NOK76257.1 hypothetical protein [Chloroflexi bacterium AL-N5]NOK84106.1 hypothetical protein [Chloroflexi bacterium AL-W]NOK91395.1 hypothetical protein [Chloroflexi bacterium AL-N15]